MSEVVRGPIRDCEYHQSFLPGPLADVAEPCFALFFIGSAAEAASMAPIFHFLAMLVNANGTLGTLEDRITELREVTEASRARSAQVRPGKFVCLGLFATHIFLERSQVPNFLEICLDKIIVFIVLDAFVVVIEVNLLLCEGSL